MRNKLGMPKVVVLTLILYFQAIFDNYNCVNSMPLYKKLVFEHISLFALYLVIYYGQMYSKLSCHLQKAKKDNLNLVKLSSLFENFSHVPKPGAT